MTSGEEFEVIIDQRCLGQKIKHDLLSTREAAKRCRIECPPTFDWSPALFILPGVNLMSGRGFWLNPLNGKWAEVRRHELAMQNSALLKHLGVESSVIDVAQGISPFSRDGENELRLLGIRSGLIRVRDQGRYVAVQFDAPESAEVALLRFVHSFLEAVAMWRPHVCIGNLRTNHEQMLTWSEFLEGAGASSNPGDH